MDKQQSGNNSQGSARKGDKVSFHYTGILPNGVTFDSSAGKEPLQITLGKGNVIPGLEEALAGMRRGQKKSLKIPVMKAYGPRLKQKLFAAPRNKLPEGFKFEPGQEIPFTQPDGLEIPVRVLHVDEKQVVFDGNHPLAGYDLMFELEMVDVIPAHKSTETTPHDH